MTTVVLMVLALAWGAVLVFWLRSRSQGSFGDSVGLFHRHLHVLERAAPGTLTAANRLRVPTPGPIPLTSRMGARVPSTAASSGRPALTSTAALTTAARRRQTRRRRRDVLFVLAVVVMATLIAAVATGSRTAVYAQLLADVALGGYVTLLVRIRNLAAERELKLRVLPTQSARALHPPRRSAARASGAAYALAGGYGDLAGRRAAAN